MKPKGQQLSNPVVQKRQLRPLPHRSDGKVKNSNSSFKKVKKYLTKCNDNRNNSQQISTKTFVCSVKDCGKEYRYKSLYERHLRLSHSEKTLRCDHSGCDYMTGSELYMKQHLMIHSDDRPFTCTDRWVRKGIQKKRESENTRNKS